MSYCFFVCIYQIEPQIPNHQLVHYLKNTLKEKYMEYPPNLLIKKINPKLARISFKIHEKFTFEK